MTAIDQDEAGLRLLREAIPEASAGRVTIARAAFAELPLPSAGLVHAGFSLPFCAPGDFAGVWRGIRAALVPGGVFAGQLFGPRDSWAQSARMSFHSADQVEELLSGTEVLFLEESAWDGEAFSGPKRWHVFNIMFRQPLLAGLEPQGAAQALGGGEESERLDIAPGTPVIDIIRLAVDAEGSPLEVNEMTADASAYVFRYEFSA